MFNVFFYILLFLGSGVALQKAIQKSGLDKVLSGNFGKHFTEHSWNSSLFIVCLISIILSNAMTGVAACVVFLPLVINMVSSNNVTYIIFMFYILKKTCILDTH